MNYTISICMAVFNGSNFIFNQISSILPQLSENDEIVCVDDNSSDNSVDIIKSFCDNRIKIYNNPENIGVNATFEKSILMAKNDYIFLCDQDDIWKDNRAKIMINSLQLSKKHLLVTNYDIFGSYSSNLANKIINSQFFGKRYSNKIKCILRIFLGTSNYFGCCMCFHRDFIKYVFPFPKYLNSHDIWIAFNGIIHSEIYHSEYKSLNRRIHLVNLSYKKNNFFKKIHFRILFIAHLILILFKKYKII